VQTSAAKPDYCQRLEDNAFHPHTRIPVSLSVAVLM